MPDFLQTVMLFTSDTHFIQFAQAVLFRGAGLDAVWHQLVIMLAIGSALFVIALWRFRASIR